MATPVRIAIPEGVTIDSLNLTRDPVTGSVSFDWRPIERICDASGLDICLFRDEPEGNIAGLLIQWYSAERAQGGASNAVLDQLIAETAAEDAVGEHRVQRGSPRPQ